MKKIKIVLIGFIAGIMSGLFSSGGGLILVPAFIHILKIDDKKARGSATFCILPMVIASSIFYYKGNYIDLKMSLICAIGGTLGGICGAKLLNKIAMIKIKIIFIIFLFFVSLKMLF